jgi:hypothetical protein
MAGKKKSRGDLFWAIFWLSSRGLAKPKETKDRGKRNPLSEKEALPGPFTF